MTSPEEHPGHRAPTSLLREPLLHFFALGLLLFLAQRFLHEDPRDIVVTPNVRASLARRFEDVQGHPPSPLELAQEIKTWSRDEALFREAMRRGLEQDDASVRGVLVDKMLALAAAEVRDPVPTEADLDAWFDAQKSRYELPVRYDFEFLTVDHKEQGKSQIIRLKQALAAGAPAHLLGQPLRSAHLEARAMQGRVAPELATAIPQLVPGTWHEVAGASESWLVRVKRKTGGLPTKSQIRESLRQDWVAAERQKKVDEILDRTAGSYHIEERP